MKKEKSDPQKFTEFRRQAEELISQDSKSQDISDKNTQKLIYELQVHQIELEMQNEELRLTREKLEESCDRYLDLYDFAPLGYVTLDQDGLIIEANLTGANLLGVERVYLIKKKFTQFIAYNSQDIFYFHQKKVFETRTHQTCELKLIKNGDSFYAQLESIAVPDSKGSFNQFRIAVTDITERKKAEQELEKYRDHLKELVEVRTEELEKTHEQLLRVQHLESLGLLAGGIAHDFNNILFIILSNIHLVRLNVKPEDTIFEMLTKAEEALFRATNLTKQLLTFSKGGMPIKKVASMTELIEDSADFPLRGSNVSCEYFIPSDLWPVGCDRDQVSQVINNLIINADQAMPSGGTIKVGAENIIVGEEDVLHLKAGRYVKISIEDQGIGISREHLLKIFDPFFTTKEKGSGLGLTTSYSIIKKHDGHIDVKSEPGKGTTFYLYLPASEKELPTGKEEEGKLITGQGKILFMDDEEGIRYSCGTILETIGYKVEPAKNGKEAIELYKKAKESNQPFDAVILDLIIPGGLGGKEVVEKLLEMDPDVKAIACSGYSTDPVMSNPQQYGFSAVMVKPCHVEEMSVVLHELIG
ncbi:response regulator [Candidatus Desantisbacteria bacterium]|nr:response regulator [Candidatus Desantisbacteria bacterium]